MPAGTKVDKAEKALKSSAAKKGFTGKRADRYTFGALNNLGLMHGSKPTKAGMKHVKTAMS